MNTNTFQRITLEKREAIRYFGSVGAISRILDVSSPAVSKWPSIVPERSAWALWYVSTRDKTEDKLEVELWQ